VPAKHQAAGGFAIEAMRQGGLARQAEAQRIEIVLQTYAALGSLVDGDSGWLIEDINPSR